MMAAARPNLDSTTGLDCEEARIEHRPWFVLQVQPRREMAVAHLLDYKGYEHYVPMLLVRRQWSDRVKEYETPALPGYVFCRMDVQFHSLIVTTPGITRILGCGGRPEPVLEPEIRWLQRVFASGSDISRSEFTTAGARVRIQSGPLTGVEGTVVLVKAQKRLVVSVTIMQRSVSTELDANTKILVLDGTRLSAASDVSNSAIAAFPAN